VGRLGLGIESEPHVVGRLGSGPESVWGGVTFGDVFGSGVVSWGSCLQGGYLLESSLPWAGRVQRRALSAAGGEDSAAAAADDVDEDDAETVDDAADRC